MSSAIRILLLADTHIGLDLPERPRVERRRRGHDFLANYAAALEPALAGVVDVVVHGGDVFDRSRVSANVAWRGYEPLRRVADRGVPVFVVPGNHERSRLPHNRLVAHPHVHVFDRPRTYRLEIRGRRVALSGFPYERRDVRTHFPELLERTGWRNEPADVRLMILHHCVEGATVGPGDFTFTSASDVIRVRDVPDDFAAVFSGHIHRHQVLTSDLRGRPLAVPVLYPGSVERTSQAEIGEAKGFLVVHAGAEADGRRARWEFRELAARPMLVRKVAAAGLSAHALEREIRALVAAAPADAVLTIRIDGDVPDGLRGISSAHLRTFVPPTMNLEIRAAGWAARQAGAQSGRVKPEREDVQLELASLR